MSEATDQLKKVELPAVMTVGNFADAMAVPVTKVITELMRNGVMATINEQIDFDTAAIIGSELGFDVQPLPDEVNSTPEKVVLKEGEGAARPPGGAVMGHV